MADNERAKDGPGEPMWLVPPPANRLRTAVAARIEELEAQLRATWNDDLLVVYADQLQLIGDPRGELIALDFAAPSEAGRQRRGELLRQWFSGDRVEVWWSDHDSAWLVGSRRGNTWLLVERGLIEAVHAGALESRAAVLRLFLESPTSEFLHRLSISGSSTALRLVLAALTARDRPWLRSLAIKRLDDDDRQPLVDGDALVTTLPNLASVELDGRRLIDRFDHANVAELVLTGHDAIDLSSGAWPNVSALDYACRPGWARIAPLRVLLTRDRFPGLRRLSLARQEPGGALLPQLCDLEIADQLTHLVLPALRSHSDVEHVQAAIDQMPALREVKVERSYMCFGQLGESLHHPSARIRIPPAWPWIPRDQITAQLMVWSGGTGPRHECDAAALIEALEAQHAELSPEVQATWFRFWLDAEGHGNQAVFADQLSDALEALGLDSPSWREVREEARMEALGNNTLISIRWEA